MKKINRSKVYKFIKDVRQSSQKVFVDYKAKDDAEELKLNLQSLKNKIDEFINEI